MYAAILRDMLRIVSDSCRSLLIARGRSDIISTATECSSMGSSRPQIKSYVSVIFERRGDGGLRAYSNDVPELVLSHSNVDALLSDVKPALEVILSAKHGCPVTALLDGNLRNSLELDGIIDKQSDLRISTGRPTQARFALVG